MDYNPRLLSLAEGFFENGASAFQAKERPIRQVEEKQKRIEFLEKKVTTKDEVLARTDGRAHRAKKKSWGALTRTWVPHDVRDQVGILSDVVGEDRDRRRTIPAVAGHWGQQVSTTGASATAR